jgi:hypothetical protein
VGDRAEIVARSNDAVGKQTLAAFFALHMTKHQRRDGRAVSGIITRGEMGRGSTCQVKTRQNQWTKERS